MRILKITAYIAAALVVFWLIAATLISGDCRFEKSTAIKAPVEKVWQNTNTLRAMDSWSPWQEKDPNVKKVWSGSTGQRVSSSAGKEMMLLARVVLKY